ncbi:hypothetical protein R1flu_010055 [Riccia fluitans]|uniref:Uncharacterized protein n=1 Tax=Riccia fluitans TaxID=41844 RepID=A0ABD1Z4S1_9MARC
MASLHLESATGSEQWEKSWQGICSPVRLGYPGGTKCWTLAPEYMFGQGLYLGRLVAAVMLDSGTKGAMLCWLTFRGDVAAHRFT